jgi:hypothetical protein
LDGGERGKPWTPNEIDLVVAAYFALLGRELRGERPIKADIVRELRTALPARSVASIERKMQNISAVLDEEHRPWIDGYKPLAHYQHSLRDVVEGTFARSHRLAETLAEYQASAIAAPTGVQPTIEDVLVEAPSVASRPRARSIGIVGSQFGALQDYQNRRLGKSGEEWVLAAEQASLRRHGRDDLAERVVWVANDVGDGAGYDIESYRPDGSPLLIEVKTTNLGLRTPFYVTRWEVAVSAERSSTYSLYRVFDFRSDPRLYRLDGSIERAARLTPTVFLGVPR